MADSTEVRAAKGGVEQVDALDAITEQDLRWAEAIFVMEEKHKSRLVAAYRRIIQNKPVHVLDIPDEYRFMDPELVEELQRSVGAVLGLSADGQDSADDAGV